MPSDVNSDKYPISIKGIVIINNRLVLLKNEREEWELPGGKIEIDESAEDCVVREIKEELNIDCELDKLVDVWMYNILNKVNVFIVTYLCKPLLLDERKVDISYEHKELGFFSFSEINDLNMPVGYKNSIKKCLNGY
ncbi:MAG: NUDIX hydrolase [Bergeyella sp.]|nr:NUDIX hydrolase [Bergeyella sp.]